MNKSRSTVVLTPKSRCVRTPIRNSTKKTFQKEDDGKKRYCIMKEAKKVRIKSGSATPMRRGRLSPGLPRRFLYFRNIYIVQKDIKYRIDRIVTVAMAILKKGARLNTKYRPKKADISAAIKYAIILVIEKVQFIIVNREKI
mgnify:CR=1 FL=1